MYFVLFTMVIVTLLVVVIVHGLDKRIVFMYFVNGFDDGRIFCNNRHRLPSHTI